MTATAPQQAVLPLARATLRRPVVNRSGALAILGIESWTLDGLIESGSLGFVVDIATEFPRTPGSRSELRFLAGQLEAWAGKQPVADLDAAAVARLVFGTELLIRSRRLLRGLACTHHHLYALAEARALPMAEGATRRRGCGGGGVWRLADVVAFLEARRV